MSNGRDSGDEDNSSDKSEQLMLRMIKGGRMLLKVKRVYRDLEDFDKSEATLKNGRRDRSTNANIDLVVNRELEGMKPHMAEKNHDIVAHLVHFARKVKEDEINDENLPQAALEYYLAHPTKLRYTTQEVKELTQDASIEGAKQQKGIDDKELAEYKPFMEKYYNLAIRFIDEQKNQRNRDPLQEMVDNISEYRNAGIVYTWKDLADMGFLNWARPSSSPRYPVESPGLDLSRILKGKGFACPTCSAPIHVSNPYATGKVMCFNCQKEFDYILSDSERGKAYKITNGKRFVGLGFGA